MEIGDHAVAQGMHHGDAVGGAAFHLAGEVAHGAAPGEDAPLALPDRHHRRLLQQEAFAHGGDAGIGRPQVDGQVVAEVFQKLSEHES